MVVRTTRPSHTASRSCVAQSRPSSTSPSAITTAHCTIRPPLHAAHSYASLFFLRPMDDTRFLSLVGEGRLAESRREKLLLFVRVVEVAVVAAAAALDVAVDAAAVAVDAAAVAFDAAAVAFDVAADAASDETSITAVEALRASLVATVEPCTNEMVALRVSVVATVAPRASCCDAAATPSVPMSCKPRLPMSCAEVRLRDEASLMRMAVAANSSPATRRLGFLRDSSKFHSKIALHTRSSRARVSTAAGRESRHAYASHAGARMAHGGAMRDMRRAPQLEPRPSKGDDWST
jgi:hypothetical protein